jgi:serine protease Do
MYYEDPNQKNETPNSGTNNGTYSGAGAGRGYNPFGTEDDTAPLNTAAGGGTQSSFNGSPNATYTTVPRPDHSGYQSAQQTSYQSNSYGQPNNGGNPPHNEPPQNHRPVKTKKKSSVGMSGGKVIALAAVCALLGGAAGFGGAYGALTLTGNSTAITADTATVYASDRTPVIQNTELVSAGDAMTTSQIYKTYSDSVVCITVQTSSGTGAGTGFFISDDGYIMTCYHVIDGQQAMSVTLNDGTTSYEATYVGGDEELDVAIIKIDATDNETFHAVTLGKSELLEVGDNVTVIGNALGSLANTTTSGIVSALNRAITMSDGTVMNLLQSDCTINSGNSGGPMFNQYGEVIGIVNAKYSSSAYDTSATIEGIGFAIPIDTATNVMADLMEHGYVTGKPYLGISVSTVSSIMAQQYPNQYVVGAYVNSVNSGSCAETAGLQQGDIITQVDGEDITTSAELIDAKANHRAGEQMTMLVFRGGEYYTITVTLDEQQPEDDSASSDDSSNGNGYSDGNGNGYSDGSNGYGYGYGNGGSNGGSSGGSSGWPWSYFGGGW